MPSSAGPAGTGEVMGGDLPYRCGGDGLAQLWRSIGGGEKF